MCGRVVRWLWMGAMIALLGCGKPTVPPVKPAATPAPAKTAVAVDTQQPAAKMPEAVVAKAEPKNDAASSPAAESPSKAAEPPAGKPEEKPAEKIPARPERIAVLTPGGPLLIDVTLSMDGKSHSDLFATRIQQVFDAADTDHDHQCTWSELAANEEFLKAERCSIPIQPSDERKRGANSTI